MTNSSIKDMKTLVATVLVGFGVSARGGILAGPVINPANGHVYYLLSQNTWSNAEAEAVSLGGHLATIRNAAENSWVYSTFCESGGALWIGLTDREKAFQFAWTSGEPVCYTNWGGGQPDNGDGVEFYVHLLPRGHYAAGKWNDYANFETVLAEQFPLYGVAEVLPTTGVRFSMPIRSNPQLGTFANPSQGATASAELHVSAAIELTWISEKNKLYQVEWTSSLDEPHWETVGQALKGTGAILSAFDSTREHRQGFYRVEAVQ